MASATINCGSCGKAYVWQAQYAGHSVRCTCGRVIDVPVQAPTDDYASVYELAPSENGQRGPAGGTTMPVASDGGNGDGQWTMPCPSCGRAIEFGSVTCVACGYNVRTGEHEKRAAVAASHLDYSSQNRAGGYENGSGSASVGSTAGSREWLSAPPADDDFAPTGPAPMPSPVASAPVNLPGYAVSTVPVPKHVEGETRREVLIRYLGAAGVVLVLVAAVFLYKSIRTSRWGMATHPEDVDIVAKIDRGQAFEVRQWLAGDPERVLGGWNRRQAESKLDELYKLGASKVWCFGGRMALSFIIELPPSNPDRRTMLFNWLNEYNQSIGQPTEQDTGQRFLRVMVPP